MNALIVMLYNLKLKKYHPMWYRENPYPGAAGNFIRYKSKGHHTEGYETREDALKSIEKLESHIKDYGYFVSKELETDIEWSGEELPIDITLRTINK